MATITLKYDARNPIAKKAIDLILSLGVFHRQASPKSGIDVAIEEVKQGKVTVCKDFDDFVKKINS